MVKNNWRRELGKLMLMHFLWHSYYWKKSNEKKKKKKQGRALDLNKCATKAQSFMHLFSRLFENTLVSLDAFWIKFVSWSLALSCVNFFFCLIFCTSNYVIRLKRISTYTCEVDVLTGFAKTLCHKWLFDISQYIKMSMHHCILFKKFSRSCVLRGWLTLVR